MDPASSKLLLWLWSLTSERESSSSEEDNKKKQLFINSTRLFHLNKNRLFEGYSNSYLPNLLLLSCPAATYLLIPSQNKTHTHTLIYRQI